MISKFILSFKIASLQLLNNRKFALTFIINLAIGLVGFVLVDAFKTSIDYQIQQKSKAVLGADLSISARRNLSETEMQSALASLPDGTRHIDIITLYSMAYNGEKSRLVNVVSVDDTYPLIPALKLEKGGLVDSQSAASLKGTGIWAVPELLVQLGSKEGEALQIGEASLAVKDKIAEDPSSSTSGFSLAPKVYMHRSDLNNSGLIKRGSRLSHTVLYLLPESNKVDVDVFAEKIHTALDSQDVRISTHKTASRELNRALILLGENLSLVALIALFLAGIGASYLFKSHTQSQIKDMAVLLSIGYSQRQLVLQAFAKIFILSLLSSTLIYVLSPIILPIIPFAMKAVAQGDIAVQMHPETILFSFLTAMFTSALLCLPTLDLLGQVKPALLLKETHEVELPSKFKRTALLYLPSITFFWLLSCWQSRSFVIGSAFAGAFVISALLMYLFGLALVRFANARLRRAKYPQKISWLNLVQVPSSTIVTYLAISLCALLLNIIPHLESTVSEELKYPDNKLPPSLFLFDIQEDQVEGLKEVAKTKGVALENLSPLIRARLEKTKGESVQRDNYNNEDTTREKEWENRLRNRTYNLSYRDNLIDSETLVTGRPFSGVYDWEAEKLPEISLEYRFAERLGLKVGDNMEFDIQGVNVEGVVVNTRKVKWTSFQPNFFVQFQPGVLDDAPKSFLAAIPKLPFEEKMNTQNAVVEAFPNISVVDVEQALNRISELMNNILGAVSLITLLAVLAGIAVIFSIMDHNAQLRIQDTNLYKMLGVGINDLKSIARREVAFLMGLSCLTGLTISIAITAFLTKLILDEWPVFNWSYSLQATAVMLLLGFITGYGTVARSLGKKPKI